MEKATPTRDDTVLISTDTGRLDVAYIHTFLKQTNWAWKRTPGQVAKSIAHSLNFGVYLRGRQIGYARVVSDFVIFAYIMDVFIDPDHRKKGYARQLMDAVMTHPELKEIQVWRLMTGDAHGLYEKFGFVPLAEPGNMMEKIAWKREP